MTWMSWRASTDGLAARHGRICTCAGRRSLEPQMHQTAPELKGKRLSPLLISSELTPQRPDEFKKRNVQRGKLAAAS